MTHQTIAPQSIPSRTLSTGETIPCIGMGTFGSDHCTEEQVAEAVAGAIRCGYRMFDGASVYGNEAQIGTVYAQAIADGCVKREELFLTSKVWNDQHGKGEVLLACAQSLKDLGLDYLDAYFVHWPFPNYHAPHCTGDARNPESRPFSTEEFLQVWRQMEHLHQMGLVRNLGMSNMTVPKLQAVLPLCTVRPTLIEMELHPCFQQQALYDYCVSEGIQPIGYCPVGSPARPERDKAPEDFVDTELPEVLEIAKAHGVHPAIICLKWAVQRGEIVIPFSVTESHYIGNLRAVTEDPLSAAELEQLRLADKNCRFIKGQVFLWEGAESWHALWDEAGYIQEN